MKNKGFIFLLSFVFVPASLAYNEAQALTLRAGFSTRSLDLPPGIALASYTTRRRSFGEKGTPLATYFKASTGYLDPIRVKSAVLDFKGKKLALVSIDLVAIAPEMFEAAARDLKDIGFDSQNIFISAVHTHSGPGGYVKSKLWEQMALDKFKPQILASIITQIENSVRDANSRLVPAHIGISLERVDGVTINRRHSKTLDPILTLIRVDNSQGLPIGSIINFSIHGTVLDSDNLKLSSDVPGSIERHFENLSGVPSLFFQADEGDIAPDTQDKRDYPSVEKLGNEIANKVFPIWNSLPTNDPESFKLVSIQASLGTPRFNLLGCMSLLKQHPDSFEQYLFPAAMEQPFFPLNFEFPKQVQMSGFRINGHAFIFIPGEIIASIGLEIKKGGFQRGYRDTSIIGLTNHYLGYILSDMEYARGGYEACVSFYGPSLGSKITNSAVSILDKLKP